MNSTGLAKIFKPIQNKFFLFYAKCKRKSPNLCKTNLRVYMTIKVFYKCWTITKNSTSPITWTVSKIKWYSAIMTIPKATLLHK